MKQPPANFQSCTQASKQIIPTTEVTGMTEQSEARPLQPIRRFDVFAETKRLEALAHGEPDDVAKGYGIRIEDRRQQALRRECRQEDPPREKRRLRTRVADGKPFPRRGWWQVPSARR